MRSVAVVALLRREQYVACMAVFDLHGELRAIVRLLEAAGLDYAVCGAVALAAHGHARATKDIDILVPADAVAHAKQLLRGIGYDLEAAPMTFTSGIRVHRVSRVEHRDLVTLDLLEVGGVLDEVWRSRVALEWQGGTLHVVSRDGLMAMKRLAGRPQDLADLEALGASRDDE
jgi:hypothetical protein